MDTKIKDQTVEDSAGANEAQFNMIKIYMSKCIFNVENAPMCFAADWNPDLNLSLNTDVQKVGEGLFAVDLGALVNARVPSPRDGELIDAFKLDLHFTAMVEANGLDENELSVGLGAFIPEQIYPFTREAVATEITRAGFPQVILAPVDFMQLYKSKAQTDSDAQSEEDAATH